MNSTTKILITTILTFALLSSVTTSAVFATGNLDDEEEEEVLEELQTAVQEIQGTLGTLTLNLTEGSNNIEANCPTTEEIVEEVLENITAEGPVQNVTEPEPQQCPVVEQQPQQNNTEVVEEPPQQTILPPAEAVEQNETGCNPVPEPQQNTTEIIEEVIENVTDIPEVECNIVQEEQQQQPQTNQSVIPGIVLPNITEPVEPVTPVQNETQQPECNPIPEPVQNETVSQLEPIYCPINGELLGYTNTTSGEQLPISAGQQEQQPQEQSIVPEVPQTNNGTVQDEQQIASIEFEAQCGCFVVDKTPEDLESNGGGSVEQSLYNQ
jgi:hypothetical protein